MSPKEKAIDLIHKFGDLDVLIESESGTIHSDLQYLDVAKACALIAVDEIISACEYNHVETFNTDWWNEVKKEIEEL